MNTLRTVFAAAGLTLASGAYAQSSVEESIGRLQQALPEMLVQYCHEQSPDTRAALTTAYEGFKAKLAIAMGHFAAPNAPQLSAEEAQSFDHMIQALGAKTLESVKKQSAQSYCTGLVQSLNATTAESLQATMARAMQRYEEAAKKAVPKK